MHLDVEDRQGELIALVTVPGGLPAERPVAWDGGLLVAAGAAGQIVGPAALAAAVDRGRASAEELRSYGQVLFEAAFGQELWRQLIDAACAERRPPPEEGEPQQGLPYLELAIRGQVAAFQALRWEALHDGHSAVAAQGTAAGDGDGTEAGDARDVAVGIVRLVAGDGYPRADATPTAGLAPGTRDDLLISGIPRELFAVGSLLTDPAVRPDAELAGIMQDLSTGLIQPRIVDAEAGPSLLDELRNFRPDVLHLIGHGQRRPDGQVTIQVPAEPGAARSADHWLTAEQLLGLFGAAGHVPKLVILAACQTASSADQVNTAPFAARLVADGVPAVIAMAGDIADTACRVFTRGLNNALGLGAPLGKAVLWGRRTAFNQRPGSWSTDWVLPTVFLAEHLPEQMRLVDLRRALAVRERVNLFALAQQPVFYGRREFVDAMDRLLDGTDPLNVLLAYTPDQGSFGSFRLLRHLGARALRSGVLPLLLGPFDRSPPVSRARLAWEIRKSIREVRALLALPPGPAVLRVDETAARSDADSFDLALAIRADLDDLVAALPGDDPVWSREAGQPRVVLLCHRVDGWLDALDDLLGMLGPTGLHPGTPPLPVVLAGADIAQLNTTRQRTWSGRPWVKAAPLDRLSTAQDEDMHAYQWWLMNPPEGQPAYSPRRGAPQGWQSMLRWVMKDRLFDADTLYGFAAVAQDYFTSETDLELLASLAEDDS